MKLTYYLIIITALAFFAPFVLVEDISALYSTYGFSLNNMLERPYVLITSIFMHASLTHLLSNILVWMFFGASVEEELGRKKMLGVFFLGAFAGDLLSLLFYAPEAISVGASAGIFALVGAGMLVRPVDLSFYPLFVPIPLSVLGVLYALYNAYGFVTGADPNVSYIGHFGGFAVGLAFGLGHTGLKRGIVIIIAAIAILVLAPLLWTLLVK